MNIQDLIFGLKKLKFFDADPDPGYCQPWIRDLEWKKVGSGIIIPNPQY
jgi:hypothetical protein